MGIKEDEGGRRDEGGEKRQEQAGRREEEGRREERGGRKEEGRGTSLCFHVTSFFVQKGQRKELIGHSHI